ncbi:endonuclease [Candidatus Bathyarchaeota archaeon]|nr:endonuclease [Candidatus Bathyarchaeota archaeon]
MLPYNYRRLYFHEGVSMEASCPSMLYRLLVDRFLDEVPSDEWRRTGKGLDWPAPENATFEKIAGAVLVQNANWRNNASKAVENLKKMGISEPFKIVEASPALLREAIRPAGFTNRKLKALYEVSKLMLNVRLDLLDDYSLKRKLLNINGIGPETSDTILLYAFNRPVIPVSKYAKRILKRFCNIHLESYAEWQTYIQENIPRNVEICKTFHALLTEFGLKYCTNKPKCNICLIKADCKHTMIQPVNR